MHYNEALFRIFLVPLPPALEKKAHHSLLNQNKAPYELQIWDFSFRNNVIVLALYLLPPFFPHSQITSLKLSRLAYVFIL